MEAEKQRKKFPIPSVVDKHQQTNRVCEYGPATAFT